MTGLPGLARRPETTTVSVLLFVAVGALERLTPPSAGFSVEVNQRPMRVFLRYFIMLIHYYTVTRCEQY